MFMYGLRSLKRRRLRQNEADSTKKLDRRQEQTAMISVFMNMRGKLSSVVSVNSLM